jgi:hypothetical protein
LPLINFFPAKSKDPGIILPSAGKNSDSNMKGGNKVKRVGLYILVFLFLCGLIELSVNYSLGKQIENQCPYCLAFTSIGANLLESRLDSWAKIKTTSTSQELDQNLIRILNHLQLPVDNHKFKHTSHNNILTLEYNCRKANETFQFVLQSDHNQKETGILISISSKQQSVNLPAYERKLKELLKCNCYYLHVGYIDYNLQPNGQTDLLRVLLKKMEAEPTDTYQENNITSVSAFSRQLASAVEPVDTGAHKVNLQAAMRSNAIEHCTYVYIGSPVILGEY